MARHLLAILLSGLLASARAEAPASNCLSSYKSTYRAHFAESPEDWNSFCAEKTKPDDIVALLEERCKSQYDPAQAAPIALSADDWAKECEKADSNQSPAEFLKAARKKYVLGKPSSELSVQLARQFLADTKTDAEPAVVAKRRELQALILQAQAVRERFGAKLSESQWSAQSLSIGKARSEEGFARAMELFDRAHAGKPGQGDSSEVRADASLRPLAPDARPVEPVGTMGGVDKGLDSPAAVKTRLMEQVRSLESRTGPDGKPVYDARVGKIMEEIVRSVPVNSGHPPHTDLVALEDARSAIDAVEKNNPVFVFNRDIKGYGLTTAARGPHKELLTNPDKTYRKEVTLKIGEKGEKEEFSLEQLAGTFLHEVGGHVRREVIGVGKNNLVDEGRAHEPQCRYYANKYQEFEEQIRLATTATPKTPAEAGQKKNLVDALVQKRDHFLNEEKAEMLTAYQKGWKNLQYEVFKKYYGEDGEIKPGSATMSQQRRAALKLKAEADAEETALHGKKRFYVGGSLTPEAKEVLGKEVKAAMELKWLGNDAAYDAEMKKRDRDWRKEKRAECEDSLASDPEAQASQNILASLDEAEARAVSISDKARLAVKRTAVNQELRKYRENYSACRVKLD